MKVERSARGMFKSLVGIALIVSFGFVSIDEVVAEEDRKKHVGSPQSVKACISKCPKLRL